MAQRTRCRAVPCAGARPLGAGPGKRRRPPRRGARQRALTISSLSSPTAPCPRPQRFSPPPSTVFSPRRPTSKRGSSARCRRAAESPPAASSLGGRPRAPVVSGGPSVPHRGPRRRGGGRESSPVPPARCQGAPCCPSVCRVRRKMRGRGKRERRVLGHPRGCGHAITPVASASTPTPLSHCLPPKKNPTAVRAPFRYPQCRSRIYFYFLVFDTHTHTQPPPVNKPSSLSCPQRPGPP